jgi:hypothetical protein
MRLDQQPTVDVLVGSTCSVIQNVNANEVMGPAWAAVVGRVASASHLIGAVPYVGANNSKALVRPAGNWRHDHRFCNLLLCMFGF